MNVPATERLSRLVAAIPWIAARDGVALDEIADRFDYPRDLLLADLQEVVFFVGVPPYTPDSLIDVNVDDDGLVWIRYADWFARPMKLSAAESLALIAAGETALSWDSSDESGALLRGLAKLRLATGASEDAIDVRIGAGTEDTLRTLRSVAEAGTCADITYFSTGRGARTERRIEPLRFFAEQGNWYVSAWCHLAQDDRIFRLDRIESIAVVADPAVHRSDDVAASFAFDEAAIVTIALPADRSALLDGLAIIESATADNVTTVTLPATSVRWLEQLMVRLGPDARLVDQGALPRTPDPAAAARRIADRYSDAS